MEWNEKKNFTLRPLHFQVTLYKKGKFFKQLKNKLICIYTVFVIFHFILSHNSIFL